MNALVRIGLITGLISALASPSLAKRHGKSHRAPSPSPHKPSEAEIEAATRLQVFLDRANFSPGKIDGQYNDVTLKALALYRQSRGEPASEVRVKSQKAEIRRQRIGKQKNKSSHRRHQSRILSRI